MKPYYSLNGSKLYQGHVLDVLRGLAAGSVQCVATSPPYWGLRDYGLPSLEWPAVRYAPMAGFAPIEVPGCEAGCKHVWGGEQVAKLTEQTCYVTGRAKGEPYAPGNKLAQGDIAASQGSWCHLCGGWRGSYGLEPTIEMYVGHTVAICRELKRVLRDDGTLWWNLGDSYAGSSQTGGSGKETITGSKQYQQDKMCNAKTFSPGLKPKDLCAIPWRVALALQADGWWLRSEVIWAKGLSFCPTYSGSCMPESVRDRPTKGHEYVFLLSKSARYFYDQEAVREAAEYGYRPTRGQSIFDRVGDGSKSPERTVSTTYGGDPSTGRNLRSVWAINPGSYAGAHFATFPPALVEPMIKAGTSAKGCCPECGAPWERVTEREKHPSRDMEAQREKAAQQTGRTDGKVPGPSGMLDQVTTIGWRPTCTCDAGDPVPCTVLDPFGGSGTTAEVAIRLGRRVVLIELSRDYCDEHIIPRLESPLQLEMAL